MTVFMLIKQLVLLLLAIFTINMISSQLDIVLGYHAEVVDTSFTSESKGLIINHPSIWRVEESPDLVLFTSPTHDISDMVLETVSITAYPSLGLTIPDFVNTLKTGFYPRADVLGSTFSVDEEKSVQINGYDAYLLVFNYFDQSLQMDLRAMDVIVYEADTFYLITYTADISSYQSYLPILEQMVDSIQISGLPTVDKGSSLTGNIGSKESSLTGNIGN